MQSASAELNELKRKVDFNTYDISVKELISMVQEGIIDIAPDYQRQFRWGTERQSQLIESIFLGIPVPSLYMATNDDGSWELIDGVQRLSSIIHFSGDEIVRSKINLKDELKLKSLNQLLSFNGKTFLALPKTVQLEFLLKPLKVTTLTDRSDTNVRFDLFERLNTGGVVLTNQEIRSCVYRGKFNDFIKTMARNQHFLETVKLSANKESDGTREEYVLRFFAFLNNYQNFDHSVVEFLNNYMQEATKNFDYKKGEEIFNKTFEALSTIPGGISRNRKSTPANLFEGVAVGAALVLLNSDRISIDNLEWMSSDELRKVTTDASNSLPKVIKRIEFSRDNFTGN